MKITTKKYGNILQWRYDHTLSEEEEQLEKFFNKEMRTAVYLHIADAHYDNIQWLLSEWRKSTSELLESINDKNKYKDLLSKRMILNSKLDHYLRKNFAIS